MKKILFIILLLAIYGCSKPKTVLICGDHICVNKLEAEEYFKENLTLEVKILDKKNMNEIDLVEINLNSKSQKEKKINIVSKNKTNKKIKILSNDEIEKRKKELKEKKIKEKKQVKNKIKRKKIALRKPKIFKKEKIIEQETNNVVKLNKIKEKVNQPENKVINKQQNTKSVDICEVVKECTIDEISKYLIKKGNKINFPDITTRE